MTKALVPYAPPFNGLEAANLDIQNKKFKRDRQLVLSELRCISGVPEIVSRLNQETLYKIVAAPKDATLYKDAAGNIKGVFYKDGKIIEHAKFEAVRPSLIKAASAIGSQILLISIAMQLNRIEKTIERIIGEFHNDRIAEICSGVSQFEQAMVVQDTDRQSRLIEHAIQTLNTGLEKTIRSLKEQIENAPEPDNSFFDNWLTNKSIEAEKKMQLAEESFFSCLLGIKTLSECFAILNEPIAAESVLRISLLDVKAAGIESASEKARLLKVKGTILPETPWKDFLAYEADISNKLRLFKSCTPELVESIEVEFKPKELLEV
jgi:hypothetical protein